MYYVEVTREKVYIHCKTTGCTVARLCKFSFEIWRNPICVGNDYVSTEVTWNKFKKRVQEYLGYKIKIEKPKLSWRLKYD